MASKTVKNDRNLATMSVGEAKRTITALIKGHMASGRPAYECPAIVIIGPVGMGKTHIMQQIAGELNMSLIARHFSQTHPLDVAGVGLDNDKREMYYAMPPLYTEVMEGKAPRLLLLDEIDRAAPMAQSALLQVLSERMLNGYKLADTYVVACANAWYAQYTFELDKAMASRMCMIHVQPNAQEWLAWAGDNNIDPRIMITISQCPDVLNQTGELTDGAMKVADPRAWASLSNALHNGADPACASAFVGLHAAVKFEQYVNIARDYSKEIQQVLDGKQVKLTAKDAEKDAILFAIYLAAAGRVTTIPQARKYLENSCEQIGDEKTYIAGKLITYNIPSQELCKDKAISEIHIRISQSTYGTD